MGMDIEVVGRTWYTVHLTDEDVEKIKKYIKIACGCRLNLSICRML